MKNKKIYKNKAYAFDALLELVVNEEREELGRARVQINKIFEIRVDALLEELVAVERSAQEVVETLLEIEKTLYENNGSLVVVTCC